MKRSISSLRTLFSAKKDQFEKTFGSDGVSIAELKIDFWKNFVMASLSKNLKNSVFWSVFNSNFSYKNGHSF